MSAAKIQLYRTIIYIVKFSCLLDKSLIRSVHIHDRKKKQKHLHNSQQQ